MGALPKYSLTMNVWTGQRTVSPFQEALGDAGDGGRTLTSSCKSRPIQLVTVDSNKDLQSGLGLLLGRAEQTAALGGMLKQPTPQNVKADETQ